MVAIELEPKVARRLDTFLRSGSAAIRSDHWSHYGKLSQIRIEGNYAVLSAGAGFDSEYELSFRGRSLKERVGSAWRSRRGTNDLRRYRDAYSVLWSETPADAHSPHQVIAQHYMRLLDSHRPQSYLEIGAGTGYLAALVYREWQATITVIDLPEVLPFGFLYLHSRFPDVPFTLPHESGPAIFRFLLSGNSVPDNSIDLAVNTASFGEMPPEQIANYFRLLRRALKPEGLLFTVNREQKVMDGVPIRFAEYPWSRHDVDLLYEPSRLHALTQPQNPMLVRLCHLAKP